MKKGAAILAVCALGIFAGALALRVRRPSPASPNSAAASGPSTATATLLPAGAAPPAASSSPAPANPALSMIEALWNRLRAGQPDPATLAEFRRQLLGGDPRQAIAAISAFLATGRDAKTGENFEVAEGGALAGAPTLRVLLMDLLGQLSAQTGGDEAAKAGREILNTKTSADEWAVSMRNVGRHEPAATAYLAGKAREMLAYDPWRTAPSAGFLEAFDVPVFAADGGFVPVFSELSRAGADPVRRAAAMALDRLSEANPVAVMGYLNSHPAELADRPFLRADYYGKADLSDSQQRSAVEFYLSRADVTPAEKSKLLGSLVAPASFITDGLLTSSAIRPESPQREAAVPTTLQAWRNENRFRDLQPMIDQTLQQLAK